ncbi:hypothetical protein CcCBS67573_g08406 [Chytriomyces confervae]|uniref:NADH:flavin oxidoreductase/NADH oxidase N-terminal domain-containing protein n=1 Tax=Chytriomyces confervae TaxID=246404 RepID=A0A507EMF9_9FUNG|nr:hypothetical protein CcCBS67573_g08406 [Chytriomyces confervae]
MTNQGFIDRRVSMPASKQHNNNPAGNSGSTDEKRTSLLDVARENLARQGKTFVLNRVIVCGKIENADTKADIAAHYQKFFKLFQNDTELITGILFLFQDTYVHVLESSEKVSIAFLRELCGILPSSYPTTPDFSSAGMSKSADASTRKSRGSSMRGHRFFSSSKVLLVADDIAQRNFSFWASRTIDMKPGASPYYVDEMMFNEENVDKTISKLCEDISNIGLSLSSLSKSELKDAMEDMSSKFEDVLPRNEMIRYIVGECPSLLTALQWKELFDGHMELSLESELVWPAPKMIESRRNRNLKPTRTTTTTATTTTMAPQQPKLALFTPLQVGDMTLEHRVALAPLTRSRSPGFVANALNALYYTQRATKGGLLISEGTCIDQFSNGYPNVPFLFTKEHAAGWTTSTEAVHAKGGYIYAQLWHVGRLSQAAFQPDNKPPVSSSATSARRNRPPARALTIAEIKETVKSYANSARLAINDAHFDGVEIHAAHGYLIEQFLNSNANLRTDEYGGSIENRARFLFEVLDAVVAAVPASKVAIRISPDCNMQGMKDADPKSLYTYVLTRLNNYNLAYIQLTEPMWGAWMQGPPHDQSKLLYYRPLLKNPFTKVMLTGGYTRDSAEAAIKTGRADMIGFGRDFITNPDLVVRLERNLPIAQDENAVAGHYSGGKEMYTDYPTWEEQQAAKFLTSKL